MEEILHHQGCIKPCKTWDILHINWLSRISSINSITHTKTPLQYQDFFPNKSTNPLCSGFWWLEFRWSQISVPQLPPTSTVKHNLQSRVTLGGRCPPRYWVLIVSAQDDHHIFQKSLFVRFDFFWFHPVKKSTNINIMGNKKKSLSPISPGQPAFLY